MSDLTFEVIEEASSIDDGDYLVTVKDGKFKKVEKANADIGGGIKYKEFNIEITNEILESGFNVVTGDVVFYDYQAYLKISDSDFDELINTLPFLKINVAYTDDAIEEYDEDASRPTNYIGGFELFYFKKTHRYISTLIVCACLIPESDWEEFINW